jgi:hypothetical protein
MKADQLGFDLYAMVSPKSHEDFMSLVREALSEIKIFNEHMASLLCLA